jgi:hypothetical protein
MPDFASSLSAALRRNAFVPFLGDGRGEEEERRAFHLGTEEDPIHMKKR